MSARKLSRREMLRASGALVAGATVGQVGSGQAGLAAGDDLTADDVRRAIASGSDFLKRQQRADGSWPEQPHYEGGLTPLCTLALLHAGRTLDDEAIARSLAYLRAFQPTSTYTCALQTMVLCAAEPKRDLLLIHRNVGWLEARQIKDRDWSGMWAIRTPGSTDHTDNSMTHFALLGLYEAERAGVQVSDAVWRRAQSYWERSQNADGSWGWGPGDLGSGSMTCAGIAALIITSGQIGEMDAKVSGDNVSCCAPQQQSKHLQKAIAWLERHFSVYQNPGADYWQSYYMYAMERAGRMTAHRFLGEHDWYREGARALVSRQMLSGAWPSDVEYRPVHDLNVSTSFSLMFLAKGRWPIVMAQLKHEPADDWNHHRRALFNLVSHVERSWEMNLTYQVVDIGPATVEGLLESPVLFLSGRDAPQFTAEEKQKLRMYVDRGGFIFAMQSCGDGTFDEAFRALMAELFSDADSRMRPLPASHPVWHADQQVDAKYLPDLWGIEASCRTAVVYCPQDLSCYWELARVGREGSYSPAVQQAIAAARTVGTNVLAYATNRELNYKDPAYARSPDDQAARERGIVRVANVRHPGGCDAAPAALGNLLRLAAAKLMMPIGVEPQEVRLTDPALFDYHLVFIHGRTKFSFTPAERSHLRTYLERDGMVLADAVCSSREFAESFRREIAQVFPDIALREIPAGDPLFSSAFGGEDIRSIGLRQPSSTDGTTHPTVRQGAPYLEGIQIGDRYALIFSPYDLSCALETRQPLECEGYTHQDAARIAINVLLYSLNH